MRFILENENGTKLDSLYQWDFGVYVNVGKIPHDGYCHFINDFIGGTPLSMAIDENGKCKIPNQILRSAGYLTIYVYTTADDDYGKTLQRDEITIQSRPLPPDQVSPDDPTITYPALSQLVTEMNAIKQNLTGGTTNQILAKNSNADYDYKWVTGGGGGTIYSAGDGIDINAENEISVKYDGDSIVLNADGELEADVDVPTKTSELTNDSGFITSAYHDSTKADVSTTYTKTETDTRLNAKQDTLVSATNIKTINNQSILGSGNIDIQGGGGTTTWGNIGGTLSNQTDLTEIVSSNNLFNNADTDIKPNVYINGSGREVSDANYITTGFIPVTALSYYKWWSSSSGGSVFTSKSVRVASYGEDKTFISATSSSDAANGYQAVLGAKYIRISYTRNFPDNLMCCIATYTPTTYEAYISKTIIKKTLVYVDDSVNSTSTNPIQNKVIKEYVDSKPYLNPHECNLPDTIYAFANYEIDLHLRNIYNYEDGDALTRARVTVSGGGNFGKLDSKKLSYTPTSAETKLAQIYNFDHNYNALNSDVKTISVVNASTKSSLKTLVIGDSFVYGGKMTLQMLENAEEDNYDLTFLGTRGSSTNQHEGRSGWTALMYCTEASTNAFYNPSLTTTSKFDFSYYMTNQGYSGVDCVFINLGTNDLFSTRTDTERTNAINTWLANLDNMVNSIHAYDSNIKIVINPPIPSSRDEDTWGEIYAAANPPVFQMTWLFSRATHEGGIKLREHYANASNVYVGWTNASIDTANMVGDVHPTETGYRQIGNAMYSIMRAIN